MTLPHPRLFGLAVAFFLSIGPGSAQQPDDPEFNGRRGSEWARILKEDSSARKRRAAVVALGQLWTDNQYFDSLPNVGRALQQDPSEAVRLQAATVLGQIKREDLLHRDPAKGVIVALANALQAEKDSAVRRESATALGRFGALSKAGVLPLMAVLKDPEPTTRAAAADALGRIGPDARAAAPELLPLLKDMDKGVQKAAIFALGRIGPEDAEAVAQALAEKLKTEKDGELRKELVGALGLLGERSEGVALALAGAMKDEDAELRRLAARALAGFGLSIQPAVPALLAAFQMDKDKNVRIDAVRALGAGLGPAMAQYITILTERLNIDAEAAVKGDADFEVRIVITDELGALGPAGKPAVAALRRALRDPQVKVREAAAVAIRKIEKPIEKKP